MTYEVKDLVHEDYQVDGTSVGYLKKDITQIPFLSISEIFYKMNRYSELGAEKLQSKGKKSAIHVNDCSSLTLDIHPHLFLKARNFRWFPGFVIAFSNMEGTFYRYLKFRELAKKSVIPSSNP